MGYYAGFNTTVVVLESEHLEVDELVEQQVDYSTGSPMMVPHTMQYTQVIVANEINHSVSHTCFVVTLCPFKNTMLWLEHTFLPSLFICSIFFNQTEFLTNLMNNLKSQLVVRP